jgi:hypothetical protein
MTIVFDAPRHENLVCWEGADALFLHCRALILLGMLQHTTWTTRTGGRTTSPPLWRSSLTGTRLPSAIQQPSEHARSCCSRGVHTVLGHVKMQMRPVKKRTSKGRNAQAKAPRMHCSKCLGMAGSCQHADPTLRKKGNCCTTILIRFFRMLLHCATILIRCFRMLLHSMRWTRVCLSAAALLSAKAST